MKIYSNVAKSTSKTKSGGGGDEPKKKKAEVSVNVKVDKKKLSEKMDSETGVWTRRKATERGYSATPKGNYNGNAAPHVGGAAKKSEFGALKGGTKKHMKAAKSMVRKGTGDGAKRRI
jgi:hypothetical protein